MLMTAPAKKRKESRAEFGGYLNERVISVAIGFETSGRIGSDPQPIVNMILDVWHKRFLISSKCPTERCTNMSGKRCMWTIRAVLSILGFSLVCGCSQGLKRGEIAPDFALESVSGDTVELYDSPGDLTLLCFWAVGCPPCRDEAPHLQHLHDTIRRIAG